MALPCSAVVMHFNITQHSYPGPSQTVNLIAGPRQIGIAAGYDVPLAWCYSIARHRCVTWDLSALLLWDPAGYLAFEA